MKRKASPWLKRKQVFKRRAKRIDTNALLGVPRFSLSTQVNKKLAQTTLTRTVNVSNLDIFGGSALGALKFELDALPAYTDFTNAWQEYRIDSIELAFYPSVNQTYNETVVAGATTLVYQAPVLVTAVDPNDVVAPANEAELLQHDDVKVWGAFYEPVKVKFKPMVQVAVYQGTFTGYKSEAPGWIEVGSPSVQHFGLKYSFAHGVQGATGASSSFAYIYATYHLSLRAAY